MVGPVANPDWDALCEGIEIAILLDNWYRLSRVGRETVSFEMPYRTIKSAPCEMNSPPRSK